MGTPETWWVWQGLFQWATEVINMSMVLLIKWSNSFCYSYYAILTCLHATYVVWFSNKGNVYNIPVCLWLLDTYPYNPPICFVKPTSAMMIKTGKHIDANGKIYLPYLHEWKHVSPRFYLFMFRVSLFGLWSCGKNIENKITKEIFVVPFASLWWSVFSYSLSQTSMVWFRWWSWCSEKNLPCFLVPPHSPHTKPSKLLGLLTVSDQDTMTFFKSQLPRRHKGLAVIHTAFLCEVYTCLLPSFIHTHTQRSHTHTLKFDWMLQAASSEW